MKSFHKLDPKKGMCAWLEGLVITSPLRWDKFLLNGFTLIGGEDLSSKVVDIPIFSFYSYSSLKPKSF